jgi:sugar/nucleoside kinase (ribokinase family)
VPPVAVLGNLSRDLVDGAPPRVGGPPFYAARALRLLGADAIVATKCAESDRAALLEPLLELGLPVLWSAASRSAAFSFRYDGDERSMSVDALGDSWRAEDLDGWAAGALDGTEWIHVGALARDEFGAEAVATLAARGRRVLFDAQGLVRPARTGPLALEPALDATLLRHVAVLKLAEEEARALAGGLDAEALETLGVEEVLVTLGSRGSIVLTGRRCEAVPALPVEGVDPTGAGDAFAAAYVAARNEGAEPLSAATSATELVHRLLEGER